jgi:hypothetical protein
MRALSVFIALCIATPAISQQSCQFGKETVRDGDSRLFFSRATAPTVGQCYSTSAIRKCSNGQWTGGIGQYAECVADNRPSEPRISSDEPVCVTTPNGPTYKQNEMLLFYSRAEVRLPQRCRDVASWRTCQSGTFNGSSLHVFLSCRELPESTPQVPAQNEACAIPNVGTVPHGRSVKFFTAQTATPPDTCEAHTIVRMCDNGSFGPKTTVYLQCTADGTAQQRPGPLDFLGAFQTLTMIYDGTVVGLFVLLCIATFFAFRYRAQLQSRATSGSIPETPHTERAAQHAAKAPREKAAPQPQRPQPAGEQSPGPGKLTGYEIERPWERPEIPLGADHSDQRHTSSGYSHSSSRQERSTRSAADATHGKMGSEGPTLKWEGMVLLLKIIANAPTYVVLYLLFMIPTYLLPYVGSNSAALNAYGKSAGIGFNPAFWWHLVLLLVLCVLAWARGTYVAKTWLIVFPIIASVFDLVAGLNLVPFVPTIMHLCAIIVGVSSQETAA